MPPTAVAVKCFDDSDLSWGLRGRAVVADVRKLGPLPGHGVAARHPRCLLTADVVRAIVPGEADQADRHQRHDAQGQDHEGPANKPSHRWEARRQDTGLTRYVWPAP